MSRKDYALLAAALGAAHYRTYGIVGPQGDDDLHMAHMECMMMLADVLAADNPRFDEERFFDAYRAAYIAEMNKEGAR